MKKLVFKMLVLFSIAIMSSCSSNNSDDVAPETSKSEIKMTIDGNELIFNSVVVNSNTQNAFGEPAIELTGTINKSADKVITLTINKSQIGGKTLSDFTYVENGTTYYFGAVMSVSTCGATIPDSKMAFITTTNDEKAISGNFAGNIDICSNNTIKSLKISNGSFNATY
ncbi:MULTISPECIES: hypothetical protein [unclassified Tenacibaculum]|uniref:hypothetical protein n=1 Tax=unclassified Tenacibaculum TaxID=2635139 RepID=UPI001F29CB00|nr:MULTISPECIES: hypothetical protein [unclassified Tenacibaculum]MCF2876081.1 hypothetical protein [Tenacibaculum sp. Cn5-1]MCF2936156.1 hypothetical protein [Tenacibaculum sp. Cn5-34]MCG7512717.1 hypothetical protein [Tenacibaculum sp. Cn5-46]